MAEFTYKGPDMQDQFLNETGEELHTVVEAFAELANGFGIIPVITRVTTPTEYDTTAHHANGDAVDIRDEEYIEGGDTVRTYTMDQVNTIRDTLRGKFGHDVIKWSDIRNGDGVRTSPFHFHLSVGDQGVKTTVQQATTQATATTDPPSIVSRSSPDDPEKDILTDYLTNDSEELGTLVIGDLHLTVPPTAIRFSSDSQAISIPTVRTSGDPVITSNTAVPRVQVTLYFTGQDAINNQLRPLYAMFQRTPFITVQNNTIYRLMIGRRQRQMTRQDVNPFSPVPVVLEGITLHTVPGFPDTVQASVSLALMNPFPHTTEMKFFRKTVDAKAQAEYMAHRYSKAFITRHLEEDGTLIGMTAEGERYSKARPRTSATTDYPGGSWPFTRHYRSILSEYKHPYKIPETTRWKEYESTASDIVFQYNSVLTYDTRQQNLMRNLRKIEEKLGRLKLMYKVAAALHGAGQAIPEEGLTVDLDGDKSIKIEADEANNLFTVYGRAAGLDEFNIFSEYFRAIHNAQYLISDIVSKLKEVAGELQSTIEGREEEIAGFKGINFTFMDEDGKATNPGLIVQETMLQFQALAQYSKEQNDKGITPDPAVQTALDNYDKLAGELVRRVNQIFEDERRKKKVGSGINNFPVQFTLGWDEDLSPDYNESEIARYSSIAKSAVEEDGKVEVSQEDGPINLVYNTVINSIGVSYQNSIIPIPILAYENPTFQHMGNPNATVTINLKTSDEDLLARLTDVRQSLAHISRMVTSGNNNDMVDLGLSKLTVTDDLLNSLGLEEFALRSIDLQNISGAPGWYEITIELIQNEMDLSKFERLRSVPSYKAPSDLADILFPLDLAFSSQYTDDVNEIKKVINRVMSEGKNKTRFFHNTNIKTLISSVPERIRNTKGWEQLVDNMRKLIIKDKKDAIDVNNIGLILDELHGLGGLYGLGTEFRVVVLPPSRYDNSNNPLYEFTVEVRSTATNLVDEKRTGFFQSFLRPLLKRATTMCQLAHAKFGGGKNIYSLVTQLEGHYMRFISRAANSVSMLLTQSPEVLFDGDKFKELVIADSLDDSFITAFPLNQARMKSLYILLSRYDFRQWLDDIAEDKLDISTYASPTYFSTGESRNVTDSDRKMVGQVAGDVKKYLTQTHKVIKNNYPDLGLPMDIIPENDHYLYGPSFYIVASTGSQEEDLKQASQLISNYRMSIALQLGLFQGFLTNSEFVEQYGTVENHITDLLADVNPGREIANLLKVENIKKEVDEFRNAVVSDNETVENIEQATKENIEQATKLSYNNKTVVLTSDDLKLEKEDGTVVNIGPQMTKQQLYKVMTISACLEYALLVAAVTDALQSKLQVTDMQLDFPDSDAQDNSTGSVRVSSVQAGLKNAELIKYIDSTFNFQNLPLSSFSGEQKSFMSHTDSTTNEEDSSRKHEIHNMLIKYRNDAVRLLKNKDPDAIMDYFGFTDIDSGVKRYELEKKLAKTVDTSFNGTMDRAFPTFKLFFIEEDAPNWMLFDDFYSYDAVNSIDIVESKHAASSTAVIKLSNVTNRLTGEAIQDIFEDRDAPADLTSIRLRPGTPIMIRLGYGADYRHLPITFMGAVTEVRPGPVLEITAQSWGVELTNPIGSAKGIKYGATSPEKTIGSVIISTLDQLPGMEHFGRWTINSLDDTDPRFIPNSVFKVSHFAKSAPLKWLLGWGLDFLEPGLIKQVSGVLPSSQRDVENLLAGRRPDHLMLNIGNELYDNIYVNGVRPTGYGWLNFLKVGNLRHTRSRASFDWVIYNQTGWDALWEACLHLGDYIVRPLPYNEGTNMFQNPPRMTLYLGPREGFYQHSAPMVTNQTLTEQITETMKKELKNMLLAPGPTPERIRMTSKPNLLETEFKKEILRYASELFDQYNKDMNQSALLAALAEIVPFGLMDIDNYAALVWRVINDMRNVTPTISTGLLSTYNRGDKNALVGIALKRSHGGVTPSTLAIAAWVAIVSALTGITEDSDEFWALLTEFKPTTVKQLIRKEQASSFVVGLVREIQEGLQLWYSVEALMREINKGLSVTTTAGYFNNYPEYLAEDIRLSITDVFTSNYSNHPEDTDSILNRLKRRLNIESLAANKHFAPVVEHHFVNSWEDIIANNIVATADSMYNHVQLLYSDEPTPHRTPEDAEKLRSYDAVLAYDIDPNHIRTYVSYQKNVDPNILLDYQKARTFLAYGDRNLLPNYMNVANQILSNVVKPMYQGSLTLVGNPHIRPWHMLHIYDDITNMEGPVEIEEVVHSFSSERGYTTTIVPNLVVYDRDINVHADQLYLNMLGKMRGRRLIWDIGLRGVLGGVVLNPALWANIFGAGTVLGGVLAVPLALAGIGYATWQGTKIWNNWAQQWIGMAGIMAGHNPLVFVPLNYNGTPYIAGLEGITDMGRSISSIVVGQLQDRANARTSKISPWIEKKIVSNMVRK